ncbi:GLE1-like protein-domain-containing protein [Apiosordaria backusii]|uniref:mRNA export factor GLE1 n=1 Tax=Apiosordaria backusii TaxID=314023 RepID=A0AA40BS13_9PEZI|nr:GLE1-like protein-domain-containing protein [Apiosordaria backusii]
MQRSSPSPARSYDVSSPHRADLSDIFNQDRNSPARHKQILETSRKEHTRIREEAERVLQEARLREERDRVLEQRRKEEERIKTEEQLAAERVRLNALKAKKIEIPPLLPDPEPPVVPKVAPKPAPSTTAPPPANNLNGQQSNSQVNGASPFQSIAPPAQSSSSLFATKAPPGPTPSPTPPAPAPVPAAKPANSVLGIGALLNGNNTQTNGTTRIVGTAQAAAPPAPAAPVIDRYAEIHKNLKGLRKTMTEQAKVNRALKERMGDMRREIRKCMGQLTSGAPGVNRSQQQKIINLLREALANQVQSRLIDPSDYVFEPRQPVEGAHHNEPALPSLFIYLLNIFSKGAISQFINEASARPETADPVGVCVAATISEPDFLWRGKSMIDILLAKFRIVCPVLFGYRGSEKTEQGRARLGWWKDSGRWIGEQQHMDRMTGLGAGFAAISLRKFAASKKQNPYPARHYWTAMARIVNTPAAEISNTQCIVLKAMIENYEGKFIDAYGSAAIVALRTALIEFPARAPTKGAAVNSLEVLATLLKKNTGLTLG